MKKVFNFPLMMGYQANIFFSIAPPLIIALPTLRWQSCRS